MCGIAGILDLSGEPLPRERLVRRMTAAMVHRGPDGEGSFESGPISLGFRRLAIIDPSAPPGPYTDESGSIVAAVNGEIYNYPELARDLRANGHILKTNCDTEVVAHMYEEYGPGLVDRLDGMFGIAVWDARNRRLLLARDRAGEKPVYYARLNGRLVFASELQAILAVPGISRELDPAALSLYLMHDHYPSPTTPFRHIRKLPAAHRLIADASGVRVERYWSLAPAWEAPVRTESKEALQEELLGILRDSVQRRWRSDVPAGVFLSGGLDSSSIVALLADSGASPIRTFTLGFEDPEFNEATAATETAAHFGAEHHQEIVGFADLKVALEAVGPKMADPLADPSLLPAWLVSRLARRDITVVLSGEGSDEIFGGYPTYPGHLLAARLRAMPTFVRRLIAKAVAALPVSHGNITLDFLARQLVAGAELDTLSRHMRWFGSIAPALQSTLVRQEFREGAGSWDPFAAARSAIEGIGFRDDLSRVMHLDFSTYLQDGLLTKMDRASMMHSLEVRTPFLDHRLIEFAARVPSSLKVRGAKTKILLRDMLEPLLPAAVVKRRKRGFSIPLARWIDADEGGFIAAHLEEKRLEKQGIFDASAVRNLLTDHVTRLSDNRRPLWNLLIFQLWHRNFVESTPAPEPTDTPAKILTIG